MHPPRSPAPATAALLALAVALALTAAAAAAARHQHHSSFPIVVPAPVDRADDEVRRMYNAWKSAEHGHGGHGRPRAADEDRLRLEVFRDNLRYIDFHNAEADAGLHTFRLGLTPFADLTVHEYRRQALGFRARRRPGSRAAAARVVGAGAGAGDDNLPDAVDWRGRGAVTEVKNQAQCGGCWAFSAVAAIEGVNAIATGSLVSLSEQEIIDCDTEDSGCNGGEMESAFQFVVDNGGIDTEADYPFIGIDAACDANRVNERVVTIDGFVSVATENETALQEAVASQPVSVAIDASGRKFQHYTSGIFNGACGTNLDHGVTAVGYGSDEDDYWIVKNSWSASWGEAGYIRIRRNVAAAAGKCGIAMDASYPVKSSTNPTTTKAAGAAMDVLKMVLA